jgi:hypothetical protein
MDCSSTFGSSESPWQLCHQESGDDASCSCHRKVHSFRQSVGTTLLFIACSCMRNCRTSLPNLLSHIVDSGRIMVVRWADVRFSWALSVHEALALACTGKFLKWWSSQVALKLHSSCTQCLYNCSVPISGAMLVSLPVLRQRSFNWGRLWCRVWVESLVGGAMDFLWSTCKE